MLGILAIVLVILGFIGLCVYGIVMPKLMVKKGRKVDARVLSCEERDVRGEEGGTGEKYYKVTVDFYGLNGETIVKTIQSEKPYEAGEVIRSRYLDKRGFFYPDADKDVKSGKNGGLWAVIVFCVLLLVFIAFVLFIRDEDGELPQWFSMGFGYFISILFIGIGLKGVWNRIVLKKRAHLMQTLTGQQVDYREDRDSDSTCYFPIYEYEWMGETKRLYSHVGGTAKKYRDIGRKVHILRDPENGRVYCKEDEKSSGVIYTAFGLIGMVVLAVMIMCSLGFLDSDLGETGASGHEAREETAGGDATDEKNKVLEMYYMYADESAQKCSYCVQLYSDRSGEMILFPMTTVSGKGIDQFISFELTLAELRQVGEWIKSVDLSALEYNNTTEDKAAVIVTFYIYTDDKTYGGAGLYGDDVYTEGVDLLKEVIPEDVWEEMEKREEKYYQ
ncbi:MAG: DUF3592 domain-containing protein [Lachnospiraceae bacterium]